MRHIIHLSVIHKPHGATIFVFRLLPYEQEQTLVDSLVLNIVLPFATVRPRAVLRLPVKQLLVDRVVVVVVVVAVVMVMVGWRVLRKS